jgi:hypothetical protein
MATADNVKSGAGHRGSWALLPVALVLAVLFETVEQQTGQSAGVWLLNLAMAALILALPVALLMLLIRALR